MLLQGICSTMGIILRFTILSRARMSCIRYVSYQLSLHGPSILFISITLHSLIPLSISFPSSLLVAPFYRTNYSNSTNNYSFNSSLQTHVSPLPTAPQHTAPRPPYPIYRRLSRRPPIHRPHHRRHIRLLLHRRSPRPLRPCNLRSGIHQGTDFGCRRSLILEYRIGTAE